MKARFTVHGTAILLVATLAWASINLNSSRSNIYRLAYPGDLVTSAQAKAMLAELDKMGPAGEAKLKRWLPANFKRFGIDGTRVKKLVVMQPDKDMKETGILLLTNPADETAAKTVIKSTKSNTSD